MKILATKSNLLVKTLIRLKNKFFMLFLLFSSSCIEKIDFGTPAEVELNFVSPQTDTIIYLNQSFNSYIVKMEIKKNNTNAFIKLILLFNGDTVNRDFRALNNNYSEVNFEQLPVGNHVIQVTALDEVGELCFKRISINHLETYTPVPFAEIVNIKEFGSISNSSEIKIKFNKNITKSDLVILGYYSEPIMGFLSNVDTLELDNYFPGDTIAFSPFLNSKYNKGVGRQLFLFLIQSNFTEYTIPLTVKWEGITSK